MTYTGRCACGAAELTITGNPIGTTQCWCRKCQQTSGGGASNNAIFVSKDVNIRGELSTTQYTTDSGNLANQSFCPKCGAIIEGLSSAAPGYSAIRLGVIDEPHGLAPQRIIWADEAPVWAVLDPALPKLPQQ